MTPVPIYFVRHGETDWNAEARLQGQHDVALNDTGRRQAAAAARALSSLVADFSCLDFAASPLSRASDTMEILRRTLGLDPAGYRVDPGLIELTFGRWEGQTWREVRRHDAAQAALRERDKWNFVPPDGESYDMLRERLRPLVAALRRPAVLVSHGGVARVLLNLLAGVEERAAPRTDIWQGRVLVLDRGPYRWC